MYLAPFSDLSMQEAARLCTVLMDHFDVPFKVDKRTLREEALAERFRLIAFGDPTENTVIFALSDAIGHYFFGPEGDRRDVAVSVTAIRKTTGLGYAVIHSALVAAAFQPRDNVIWQRSAGAMVMTIPADEFDFVPGSNPMVAALKESVE